MKYCCKAPGNNEYPSFRSSFANAKKNELKFFLMISIAASYALRSDERRSVHALLCLSSVPKTKFGSNTLLTVSYCAVGMIAPISQLHFYSIDVDID